MLKFLAILFFLGFALGIKKNTQFQYQKCTDLNFLPMPKSIQCDITNLAKQQIKDPCNILYILKTQTKQQPTTHIYQLIQDQQYNTFKCHSIHFEVFSETMQTSGHELVVDIQLIDSGLKSAFDQRQQSYSLKITRQHTHLQARHYVGFVRGLQTFLQSITCNKKHKNCYMMALPIQIQDQPLFEMRGLMVDSSRHFIPIHILEQTVDAMMYNKLNVLHWHIVDQDSFPLQLEGHPELAQYGSFSIYQIYTVDEVRDFIRYAMIRGVRVIPQVNTPGHAASWAKAPKHADIACTLENNKYKGTLDVSMYKTYELVKNVFKEVFQLFPDPYVHLGGNQVIFTCLKNKTDFIERENITQKDIQVHYRRKQKKMLKQLNATKKFIYWVTDETTHIEKDDDIVQWQGKKKLVPSVPNKIIISRSSSEFNPGLGAGDVTGLDNSHYSTWLDIHRINIGMEIRSFQRNVIGVIITLWSQMSNQYTHHVKIWIRSSSIAQRAWTLQDHSSRPDFLRRLTAHGRLMNRRGIPTAPATCQQCQLHAQFC